MEPITITTTIDRPREEIFDYLSDIANHAEFADHFMTEWHMTREDTYGVGAGASYRLKTRRNRFGWGDMVIAELRPPFRILLRGRGGKYNRIKIVSSYTLQPAANGTRVQYSYETEPDQLSDTIMENTWFRGWMKRKSAKALRRLGSILEDDKGRGARTTIAGVRTPASIRPLATPPSGSHR